MGQLQESIRTYRLTTFFASESYRLDLRKQVRERIAPMGFASNAVLGTHSGSKMALMRWLLARMCEALGAPEGAFHSDDCLLLEWHIWGGVR
jgi:hypothetical protein